MASEISSSSGMGSVTYNQPRTDGAALGLLREVPDAVLDKLFSCMEPEDLKNVCKCLRVLGFSQRVKDYTEYRGIIQFIDQLLLKIKDNTTDMHYLSLGSLPKYQLERCIKRLEKIKEKLDTEFSAKALSTFKNGCDFLKEEIKASLELLPLSIIKARILTVAAPIFLRKYLIDFYFNEVLKEKEEGRIVYSTRDGAFKETLEAVVFQKWYHEAIEMADDIKTFELEIVTRDEACVTICSAVERQTANTTKIDREVVSTLIEMAGTIQDQRCQELAYANIASILASFDEEAEQSKGIEMAKQLTLEDCRDMAYSGISKYLAPSGRLSEALRILALMIDKELQRTTLEGIFQIIYKSRIDYTIPKDEIDKAIEMVQTIEDKNFRELASAYLSALLVGVGQAERGIEIAALLETEHDMAFSLIALQYALLDSFNDALDMLESINNQKLKNRTFEIVFNNLKKNVTQVTQVLERVFQLLSSIKSNGRWCVDLVVKGLFACELYDDGVRAIQYFSEQKERDAGYADVIIRRSHHFGLERSIQLAELINDAVCRADAVSKLFRNFSNIRPAFQISDIEKIIDQRNRDVAYWGYCLSYIETNANYILSLIWMIKDPILSDDVAYNLYKYFINTKQTHLIENIVFKTPEGRPRAISYLKERLEAVRQANASNMSSE